MSTDRADLAPAQEPDDPDLDLPTARSYVLEYVWDCDECGEMNGSDDIDPTGGIETCQQCGQRTRITT